MLSNYCIASVGKRRQCQRSVFNARLRGADCLPPFFSRQSSPGGPSTHCIKGCRCPYCMHGTAPCSTAAQGAQQGIEVEHVRTNLNLVKRKLPAFDDIITIMIRKNPIIHLPSRCRYQFIDHIRSLYHVYHVSFRKYLCACCPYSLLCTPAFMRRPLTKPSATSSASPPAAARRQVTVVELGVKRAATLANVGCSGLVTTTTWVTRKGPLKLQLLITCDSLDRNFKMK